MIVLNICKTIANVNNIADNSFQKAFKHEFAHSCTYISLKIFVKTNTDWGLSCI